VLAQFADIAKTLGNPQRLALLEQLSQAEMAVERLAELAQLSVANASQHLQTLKRGGFVTARRQGKQMLYRLGAGPLTEVLAALRNYAEFQRRALQQTLALDFQSLKLEAITVAELRRRMAEQSITLVDVRSEAEFAQAHIPGSVNIPIAKLQSRMRKLPKTDIVAYCRDPYCISSTQAVELLVSHGYQAQRLVGACRNGSRPKWSARRAGPEPAHYPFAPGASAGGKPMASRFRRWRQAFSGAEQLVGLLRCLWLTAPWRACASAWMPEQNDAYAEQRCAGQPQPRTVACNAGCQHAYASTCGEGRESGENFHGLICVVGLAHPVAARWLEPAVCERAVSLLAVGPVPAGWRASDGAANDGEDGAGRRNLLLPAGDALVGMALFALVRAAEGHVE
jgi:rhodanese-related sulfurtransferase/DNA-binding transcriptional ArsR family regulator